MNKQKKMIEVLDMIVSDCKQDVKDFEGREFNGKTLGELHGILEAKISVLAQIVKTLVENIPPREDDNEQKQTELSNELKMKEAVTKERLRLLKWFKLLLGYKHPDDILEIVNNDLESLTKEEV